MTIAQAETLIKDYEGLQAGLRVLEEKIDALAEKMDTISDELERAVLRVEEAAREGTIFDE